jgi:hypothetical protein
MERRGWTYTQMRWSEENVRIQAMPKDTWSLLGRRELGWSGFPTTGRTL